MKIRIVIQSVKCSNRNIQRLKHPKQKDMANSNIFTLVELKQLDIKSPLRVALGLVIFLFVIILSIWISARMPKALDFISGIILVFMFFAAMPLSAVLIHFLLPHKKGVTVLLSEDEVIIVSSGFESKIANQNLRQTKKLGSKLIVVNSLGQTLKLPKTVGLAGDSTVSHLKVIYNLDLHEGKVVLRRTFMDFKNSQNTTTEIVPFVKSVS